VANPATLVTPGDVTAPATPPTPGVVPFGKGLQISVVGYTTVDDFYRFRYYKGGVLWRETPEPSVIDYDVSYGTTYSYTVAAIDTALPANASAQSGAGTGTPAPVDTPDIKPTAVTDVSFQALASVSQTRNATQAQVAVSGLSVTRSVVGSNGVLVSFAGVWAAANGSAGTQTIGVNLVVRRDSTDLVGLNNSWPLAPTPGPGNQSQLSPTVTLTDFPGAGSHTYTVLWIVASSSAVTTITATCFSVILECVELKR
jgi:hypothetical protein